MEIIKTILPYIYMVLGILAGYIIVKLIIMKTKK